MTTKPYQGYANYETWAVSMWLDNTEPLYHESRSVVSRTVQGADLYGDAAQRRMLHVVTDALEAWVKGLTPDLGPTMWNDLLTASLGHVDWAKLADGYLAEYREEQEAGR